MLFSQLKLSLAERGFIPDAIIRWGIRNLCQKRLLAETKNLERGITRNETLDIAVETAAANAQHYEVPALFYELVLGSNKKYSCCWWNDETENLNEAEANALARTADNAAVEDGMEILDLGWQISIPSHCFYLIGPFTLRKPLQVPNQRGKWLSISEQFWSIIYSESSD